MSKYVGRIEFRGGRATPVCNTDTIRTPGAKVLPYGSAAHVRNGKYTCLSEAIGVTCINLVETEGFFLHRGEYVIFNASRLASSHLSASAERLASSHLSASAG